MGFLAVCTALYDYQPQSAEELDIKEGELLYIIEKDGGDGWWKARKKAADDDDEEPEGLIPNNYVQDAKPVYRAKALYDYSRQTDEEVSFAEDVMMEVFDVTDPDWSLVAVDGEFGFAPANYIEVPDNYDARASPPSAHTPPSDYGVPVVAAELPLRPTRSPTVHDNPSPAATLARALGGKAHAPPTSVPQSVPAPLGREVEAVDDDEPAPTLPRRPPSQTISAPEPAVVSYDEPQGIVSSPPHNRIAHQNHESDAPIRSPGGFRLYNISEMVSVMGRRKKMPTTLGLNLATGTIMLSPEKTRDGPTQEWTADKLAHYSIEGKHVFLELVRPSKSLDLHAGAKDTAQEIVSALGEIAGAQKAEGFREVIAAAKSPGSIQKKGVVLYDFMAQGDDEVTVAVGDEIIILDDEKSEEWWNIRRLKNGSEGVMPSSYIEVTGIATAEPKPSVNAGKSIVEQNRLEEERLAKAAAKTTPVDVQLPERGSSLTEDDTRKHARREKRQTRADNKSRSKPDPSKIRTWTDHSGSFKVDAQFIGIADGKIHLHKVNGVKIAVPVSKMSPEDIDYVEKVTHESIEDHIPVADLIKLKRKSQAPDTSTGRSGASVDPSPTKSKGSDYDWFDFFLSAGIGPHQCERYAQAMVRDSMDESVLPDITTDTLRAIGLKEGDALKVMKYLDQKFGKSRPNGSEAVQGGIFSGPGGVLHNNTRRGRPEAARQASDVVDPSAFEQADKSTSKAPKEIPPSATSSTANGFEDDAWDVKRSAPIPTAATEKPLPQPGLGSKPLSDNMQALSLLDKPLEPTPVASSGPGLQPQVSHPSTPASMSPAPQQSQQTGANPAFFSQVNQQQAPRQRPQAPPQVFTGSALLAPPPRPTSAPQNPQQSHFGLQPLQPQLTGLPNSARPAGLGQSLEDLAAQRMRQQYLQSQPTGYGQPLSYGSYSNGLSAQPTGFVPQQQFGQPQAPYFNGNIAGSPFADPRLQSHTTGYGLQPGPAPGSLNSVLPPALQPQQTGFQSPAAQTPMNGFTSGLQPQPTGFQQLQPQATGFGQMPQQTGYNSVQLPPVPPIPQFTPSPLVPQKTGPAPSVKFGVKDAAKLTAQPTGRRANLAHATPQNPFGF